MIDVPEGCRERATIERVFFGIEPDREMHLVSLQFAGRGWGQAFQICVSTDEQVENVKRAILDTLGFDLTFLDEAEKRLVGVECRVLRSRSHGNIVGIEAFSGKRFLRAVWWRQVADPENPTETEIYMRNALRTARAKWEDYLRAMDACMLPADFIDWEDPKHAKP